MAAKTSDWRPGPTVCRCCFADGCYKDISTEYFWMGKREVYSEMLSDTFDVSIAYAQTSGPNSNSRLICEPCISRLRDASDFKRQVQECEKVFLQHLAEPGSSMEYEILPETSQKEEVKLERVKIEAKLDDDDDDFDDQLGFDDDDDDDMDDEPLTKFASKIPKAESDDLINILQLGDDTKKPEKRKSSTKVKLTTVKKAKKKESPKPSASKAASKPVVEKKKKDNVRNNAKAIIQYTTAYPFRIPENAMVCVYCGDGYEDPAEFRSHMDEEHEKFNPATAFLTFQGYIKADCTDLRCRICNNNEQFESIDCIAEHLVYDHGKLKLLDLSEDIGLQPFVLYKDKIECVICNQKMISVRAISRHMMSHYAKYTCETCGKSYSVNVNLMRHVQNEHSGEQMKCRKCKQSIISRKKHWEESPTCKPYWCLKCGERFSSSYHKKEHMVRAHGASTRTYKCQHCPKEYNSASTLKDHCISSHGWKPVQHRKKVGKSTVPTL